MTVVERLDAFFACSYRGTNGVPSWKIAKNTFVIRNSCNRSGLVVSSMDLSLNMTSYACFFSVYIGSGQFERIQSNTGFLIITGLHVRASGLQCYACNRGLNSALLINLAISESNFNVILYYTDMVQKH